MARNLGTQDVSWFLDLKEKKQLNLDPPYQRRSVWSPRDKRFFVDTILNGYPAPPIFLHKTLDESGRPTYHVVDGKQRLQTIIDFRENKIRIPDDFSDVHLQRKKWNDLERDIRERFWNYVLIVEMLPDVTDALVRNIFERINRNSRKLMPQELRHAKYDGWFVSTVEAEAEKREWKDFGISTAARAKRMADVQFLSELMAITIENSIRGFDQDGLDDLYAEYDELTDLPDFIEEDFIDKFEACKNYVRNLLAEKPEISKFLKVQTNFYTVWGIISNDFDRLPTVDKFSERYFAFMQDVSSQPGTQFNIQSIKYQAAVLSYAENARGASTDLSPRQARNSALAEMIFSVEPADDEGQ